MHDHELPPSLEGHEFPGRLSKANLKVVRQMSEAGSKPREILTLLRKDRIGNVTCRQQIYNARAKLKRDLMGGMSAIQYLFKMLCEKEYIFDYRLTPDGGLQDVTFARHDSVIMWEKFPYVMIMDSTYNTNRYISLNFSWSNLFFITLEERIFNYYVFDHNKKKMFV